MDDELDPESLATRAAGGPLMERICEHHPEFVPRWREHLRSWQNDSPGPYIDISEYAHFIDEELFEASHTSECDRRSASSRNSSLRQTKTRVI